MFEPAALLKYLTEAGSHQHGATLQVDVLHNLSAEVDRFELPVIEPSQTIANAKDLVIWNTVIFKGEDNILNDVVKTRA